MSYQSIHILSITVILTLLSIKQTTSFSNPAPYTSLKEHAGNMKLTYENCILVDYCTNSFVVVRFADVS